MAISMVTFGYRLGSCILGAIDREKLKEVLKLPENLEVVLLVALGYPAEQPAVDEVRDNDIRYWLDDKGVLHVPKRSLNKVLRWNTWLN